MCRISTSLRVIYKQYIHGYTCIYVQIRSIWYKHIYYTCNTYSLDAQVIYTNTYIYMLLHAHTIRYIQIHTKCIQYALTKHQSHAHNPQVMYKIILSIFSMEIEYVWIHTYTCLYIHVHAKTYRHIQIHTIGVCPLLWLCPWICQCMYVYVCTSMYMQ